MNNNQQETKSSHEQKTVPPKRAIHWTLIIVIAMALFTSLYIFQSLRSAPGDAVDKTAQIVGDVIDKGANAVVQVVKAMRNGTAITEFRNSNISVSAINKLQVAELSATENFTKQDFPAFLPSVEVDITIPVTYVYTVDFTQEWNITVDSSSNGVRINVIAPNIQYNTPAPDISKMRQRVIKSSVVRNEQKLQEQLRQEVSLKLKVKALDNIPLITEIARRGIKEHFSTWFYSKYTSLDETIFPIEVLFENEVPKAAPSTESITPPLTTLKPLN